MYNTGQNINSL